MATVNSPVFGASGALGAELGTLATTLAGAKVHLLNSPYVPLSNALPADLLAHEVTAAGYAPQTVTAFTGPFNDQSGQRYYHSGTLIFNSTDPVGATVSSGWLENAGGSPYLYFTFDPPLLLGGPVGANIVMDVEITGVITGKVEVVA